MTIGPKPFPDHFLSVYQSAVDDLAWTVSDSAADVGGDVKSDAPKSLDASSAMRAAAAQIAELRSHGRIYSPQGEQKSVGTVLTCASLGLKYLEALIKGDSVAARTIEGQLGDAKCDLRWASTLGSYYTQYLSANGGRRPIPYRRPAAVGPGVITIKPDARIAIVGDWGTGGGPALSVARQMAQLRPDMVIHLGDIYYSGTHRECQANFLDIVDEVFDRANTHTPIYSLAGNHDMYSGGEGYYTLIDRLNSGPLQQRASFFCLRSADNAWQLLGMDTGLNDYSPLSVTDTLTYLEPDEEQWHFERIAEFPGRTILLSHHQPFSAFSQIGAENEEGRLCAHNPRLLASYQKLLSAGRPIPAWFWGHEHSLYVYQPHLDVVRGRCLGHGAIPVFAAEAPYVALPKLDNPPSLLSSVRIDAAGDVYGNGFAILQLDPTKKAAEVRYYQDIRGNTAEVFSEALDESVTISRPSCIVDPPIASDSGTIYYAPQSRLKPTSPVKIAFVVGNQNYTKAPQLTNPRADADAMRAELEKLGFDVYGGVNFDLKTTQERFAYFAEQLRGAETALLYFSGHGVQINGQNYLIPIDVGLDALLAPDQSMQLQSLVNRMADQGRTCLVFLDACRDNPFVAEIVAPPRYAKRVGSPGPEAMASFISHGLAPVDVKDNCQAFIAFAAAPGKYAYGSTGRFSHFTEALVAHFDTQCLSVDGLMNRVRQHVKEATTAAQDPWSQTNLAREFFLRPASMTPIYVMTLLGMLSAFITSWKTFDETGHFQNGWDGWGGAFFGIAVAYGIWRWGRQRLWAAAVAFLSVTLSYKLGFSFLDRIGTFSDPSHYTGEVFTNTKLMRDIIGALIAASISVVGTIFGAAVSTPALRQLRSYVLLLFAGVLVAVILMVVTKVQSYVFPWFHKDTYDLAFAFVGAMAWQGLMGFTIGYGLSQYVPEASERRR
jgi:hypothetical protein